MPNGNTDRSGGRSVGNMATMVGREDDLQRVRDVLVRSGVCTLVGPGGVGKSTLVSALVDPLGDRAILVDARTIGRVDQVLTELAVQLDVDHIIDTCGDDVSQICVRLAARMSAAGIELLAVDQADGPGDGVMDALIRFADVAGDVAVLVATRNHPVRPFGEIVRLRPLELAPTGGPTESPSATLFCETFVLAGGDPGVLEADPDLVQQALEHNRWSPAGDSIVVASRAALVGLVRTDLSANPVDSGPHPRPDADVVSVVLERSLCDLDEDAHRVFRAAGTMRSHPLLAQVAAISGLDGGRVGSAVERLARRSLVEVVGGRVRMLPPVRQLAERLATASGERALLERRLVQWADEMTRTDPPPSTADVLAVEDDLIRAIAVLIRSGSAEHDDLDRQGPRRRAACRPAPSTPRRDARASAARVPRASSASPTTGNDSTT